MTHEAILIGAGQRGRYVYGAHALAHPHRLRFVAVAEPDERRRQMFGELHSIDKRRRFAEWEEALSSVAVPVVVIATPDRHHHAPAVGALDSGRHVLLEKPIAHSLETARAVIRAGERSEGSLHVAHVLRYTPFFTALHETVTSSRIGDIVSVEHRENVAAWHMAHSFVRGNWARAGDSTPMIVQKCCHDFDILAWNLDSPVERLHSFGSLQHFRPSTLRLTHRIVASVVMQHAAAPSMPPVSISTSAGPAGLSMSSPTTRASKGAATPSNTARTVAACTTPARMSWTIRRCRWSSHREPPWC